MPHNSDSQSGQVKIVNVPQSEVQEKSAKAENVEMETRNLKRSPGKIRISQVLIIHGSAVFFPFIFRTTFHTSGIF